MGWVQSCIVMRVQIPQKSVGVISCQMMGVKERDRKRYPPCEGSGLLDGRKERKCARFEMIQGKGLDRT